MKAPIEMKFIALISEDFSLNLFALVASRDFNWIANLFQEVFMWTLILEINKYQNVSIFQIIRSNFFQVSLHEQMFVKCLSNKTKWNKYRQKCISFVNTLLVVEVRNIKLKLWIQNVQGDQQQRQVKLQSAARIRSVITLMNRGKIIQRQTNN